MEGILEEKAKKEIKIKTRKERRITVDAENLKHNSILVNGLLLYSCLPDCW